MARTDKLSSFSAILLFTQFSWSPVRRQVISLLMDGRSSNPQSVSGTKEWPTRRVAFLVFPGIHLISLAGPLDVFTRASLALTRSGKRRTPAYGVQLLTDDLGTLPIGSGLSIAGGTSWREAPTPIDTLLIMASAEMARSPIRAELLQWIRDRSADVRRLGSICAGSFVLAAGGILDGRQATTHWQLAETLARNYPKVAVDGERIYTQDGNIWTSAGVSAGIDLALAMVEQDHGHALAQEIARNMVLFMRRGAAQRQFTSQLAAQAADHQPIRDLVAWISENLSADLSVPALARRVGMSERNFSRVFARELNMTPARFVAHLRTEAAKAKLAETADKRENIAENAGFGDGETLRRHLRAAGEAPASESAMRAKTGWQDANRSKPSVTVAAFSPPAE